MSTRSSPGPSRPGPTATMPPRHVLGRPLLAAPRPVRPPLVDLDARRGPRRRGDGPADGRLLRAPARLTRSPSAGARPPRPGGTHGNRFPGITRSQNYDAVFHPIPPRPGRWSDVEREEVVPEGSHSLTPHLVANGASEAIDFYVRAFGAVEKMRMPTPEGKLMHASLAIGDSEFYLCDEFGGHTASPASLGGTSVVMHLFVDDVDAFFDRAVAAGASADAAGRHVLGRPLRPARRPVRPPLVAGDSRDAPAPLSEGRSPSRNSPMSPARRAAAPRPGLTPRGRGRIIGGGRRRRRFAGPRRHPDEHDRTRAGRRGPAPGGRRAARPATFHERYDAMPPWTRAELIGGVVYMPSPLMRDHGRDEPSSSGSVIIRS